MDEQIFSDGVASITVINGTARLELFAFGPAGKEENGQPKPVLQRRLVMPLPGFMQMAAQIQDTMQALAKRATVPASADGPASPPDVRAATAAKSEPVPVPPKKAAKPSFP